MLEFAQVEGLGRGQVRRKSGLVRKIYNISSVLAAYKAELKQLGTTDRPD